MVARSSAAAFQLLGLGSRTGMAYQYRTCGDMDSLLPPDERTWNLTRRAFLRTLGCAVPVLAVPSLSLANATVPADSLHFLRNLVDFHPRGEWTSIPPRSGMLRSASGFYRITVHHEGNGINCHLAACDVAKDLENILGAHQKRQFGDIGYHLVIDRSGRVWEARSPTYLGAHVSRENEGNLGIMLMGNFERQRPSELQLNALFTVAPALCSAFGMGDRCIYGHRDLGHTACPGKHLYSYVARMK